MSCDDSDCLYKSEYEKLANAVVDLTREAYLEGTANDPNAGEGTELDCLLRAIELYKATKGTS